MVRRTNKILIIVYHRRVVVGLLDPVCNDLSTICIHDVRIFRTPYTDSPDGSDPWGISSNANKWWVYEMLLYEICGRYYGNQLAQGFPWGEKKVKYFVRFFVCLTYIASCKAFVHLMRSASLLTYKVNAVDWVFRTNINWNLNRASRPTSVVLFDSIDDSTR